MRNIVSLKSSNYVSGRCSKCRKKMTHYIGVRKPVCDICKGKKKAAKPRNLCTYAKGLDNPIIRA